jgi:hypothetical protein
VLREVEVLRDDTVVGVKMAVDLLRTPESCEIPNSCDRLPWDGSVQRASVVRLTNDELRRKESVAKTERRQEKNQM